MTKNSLNTKGTGGKREATALILCRPKGGQS